MYCTSQTPPSSIPVRYYKWIAKDLPIAEYNMYDSRLGARKGSPPA